MQAGEEQIAPQVDVEFGEQFLSDGRAEQTGAGKHIAQDSQGEVAGFQLVAVCCSVDLTRERETCSADYISRPDVKFGDQFEN